MLSSLPQLCVAVSCAVYVPCERLGVWMECPDSTQQAAARAPNNTITRRCMRTTVLHGLAIDSNEMLHYCYTGAGAVGRHDRG